MRNLPPVFYAVMAVLWASLALLMLTAFAGNNSATTFAMLAGIMFVYDVVRWLLALRRPPRQRLPLRPTPARSLANGEEDRAPRVDDPFSP